jgi:hypothetical protein
MTTATVNRHGQEITVYLRPLISLKHQDACQWLSSSGRSFFQRSIFLTQDEAREHMLRYHAKARFSDDNEATRRD